MPSLLRPRRRAFRLRVRLVGRFVVQPLCSHRCVLRVAVAGQHFGWVALMDNFIRLVGLGGVLGLAVELPVVAMRTYRATCRHESGLRLDNYRWLLFLGASFGFLVTLG